MRRLARLAFSCSISVSTSRMCSLAPLVVDGVIGRQSPADRRHLAAAAAGAVAAGGRRSSCCGRASGAWSRRPGLVAPSTKRAGVFGVRLRNSKRACSVSSSAGVLLALDQGVRAANLDAFEAAGALPRIDGDRVEAAAAGRRLFHGVEERPRRGDREAGQRVRQLAEILAAARRLSPAMPSAASATTSWKGCAVLGSLADSFRAPHRRARRPARAAPRVAPRRCRAGRCAVCSRSWMSCTVLGMAASGQTSAHSMTAGAQIGDELRHVAAEQALVLPRGAARRHEQAGARQNRRFGDGAVAEMAGDDVVVVARDRGSPRWPHGPPPGTSRPRAPRCACRPWRAPPRPRRRRRCRSRPSASPRRPSRITAMLPSTTRAALGAELLGDLLADLLRASHPARRRPSRGRHVRRPRR